MSSFLVHEMAHKFYALKKGYHAEFRLNNMGLFLTFISCYLIVLFTFPIERFPANFVSIAEVNIQFIHMHPCLGSILNVFQNKIQCI